MNDNYIPLNLKEVDFSNLYTNWKYSEELEKFFVFQLAYCLGLKDSAIALSIGNNPHYDFSIENSKIKLKFELKCSKKIPLFIELFKDSSKKYRGKFKRSALTLSKADYYIIIAPGWSNHIQGIPLNPPRNLFKIRVISRAWLLQDIKRYKKQILHNYGTPSEEVPCPYKLQYFTSTPTSPGTWGVKMDPREYQNFRSNDGWVGYIGTAEQGKYNYIADFTNIMWEKEKIKKVLPKEITSLV